MRKTHLFIATLLIGLALLGCTENIATYSSGESQMKAIQERYGVDFEKSPPTPDAIASLSSELSALKRKVAQNDDTAALHLLLDYRINLLDADRLLIEGFRWGEASTTDKGFGCKKGSERILNSSALRNASSNAGISAVESLQQFIDLTPENAKALGLTQRTVVSLRTSYAIIGQQAEKDRGVVMGFCFKDGNPIATAEESDEEASGSM